MSKFAAIATLTLRRSREFRIEPVVVVATLRETTAASPPEVVPAATNGSNRLTVQVARSSGRTVLTPSQNVNTNFILLVRNTSKLFLS